jgi:hypothetical protein
MVFLRFLLCLWRGKKPEATNKPKQGKCYKKEEIKKEK